MKIVVLGAGVVGTASAWYLARAGHEVTVLDRQAEAALETSFANGGQISVSPRRALGQSHGTAQGAAVARARGRPDAVPAARGPGPVALGPAFSDRVPAGAHAAQYRSCVRARPLQPRLPGRAARETGIHYDESERGILHIYTERDLFEHAHGEVALLRERGFDVAIKSADECVAIEPALAHAKAKLYGGAYAVSDESGDAHMFTQRLASLARKQGAQFRFNVTVIRIELDAGRVSRVVIDDEVGIEESVRADAFVVALGSYSRPVLRSIGIPLPIYPVKGYSITIALEPEDEAPTVSLTDHARKIVISRLGDRLRVAGTAELAGYDTEINEVRCQALVKRCFELFPKAGSPDAAQYWTGLRPATPSNLPIIGRTRFPNLYLNTGHGTLGWTMACGAGQALADIVSGQDAGSRTSRVAARKGGRRTFRLDRSFAPR